ncbi:MAG: hypothetical protein E3K36_12905 [Candidatus Brocadia sp.]|nr:hypothetical protein [Candidatus Brocadia sp.]
MFCFLNEKDTLFVALTLELDGVLWTGDKELKRRCERKDLTDFLKRSSIDR